MTNILLPSFDDQHNEFFLLDNRDWIPIHKMEHWTNCSRLVKFLKEYKNSRRRRQNASLYFRTGEIMINRGETVLIRRQLDRSEIKLFTRRPLYVCVRHRNRGTSSDLSYRFWCRKILFQIILKLQNSFQLFPIAKTIYKQYIKLRQTS